MRYSDRIQQMIDNVTEDVAALHTDGEVQSARYTQGKNLLDLIIYAAHASNVVEQMAAPLAEIYNSVEHVQGASEMYGCMQRYSIGLWEAVAVRTAEFYSTPF